MLYIWSKLYFLSDQYYNLNQSCKKANDMQYGVDNSFKLWSADATLLMR
jgi:hypothetical protein